MVEAPLSSLPVAAADIPVGGVAPAESFLESNNEEVHKQADMVASFGTGPVDYVAHAQEALETGLRNPLARSEHSAASAVGKGAHGEDCRGPESADGVAANAKCRDKRGPPNPYSVSRRDEAQLYADWKAGWWKGEVDHEAKKKWARETGLRNPYEEEAQEMHPSSVQDGQVERF